MTWCTVRWACAYGRTETPVAVYKEIFYKKGQDGERI